MVAALVLSALLAGGGMYYLQVHAFYERLPARDSVALTPMGAAAPRMVPVSGFEAIDADSSPLRYRACFTIEAPLEPFAPYPDPTPLNAPGWFDCFDARAIGAALEDGSARAYLGRANFVYGFDRVVAVLADGRAFAWHQMNACGAAVYDGDPPPPGCPPPPEALES